MHWFTGGSPGNRGEVPVMWVKQWKGCRMSCDVGEAAEGLEKEAEPHFPTLTSPHLRHSSFSNPSDITAHSTTLPLLHPYQVKSLILQPLYRLT